MGDRLHAIWGLVTSPFPLFLLLLIVAATITVSLHQWRENRAGRPTWQDTPPPRIWRGPTAPPAGYSHRIGDVWVDTQRCITYWWDGAGWVQHAG